MKIGTFFSIVMLRTPKFLLFNPNYAIDVFSDGFDTFKRKLIIAFEHSTIREYLYRIN